MARTSTAIAAANKAANEAFDTICRGYRATAMLGVPQGAIDAALAAYRKAGGRGEIVVAGRGNTTHPVCSVEVRLADLDD